MTLQLPRDPIKILPSDTSTLISLFHKTFARPPQWKVLSPGRVNLIGEHTDYNLLPVLPMPLDCAITFWVAPRSDNQINLVNVDKSFTSTSFNLDSNLDKLEYHWSNYSRAAARALLPRILDSGKQPRGFDALLESKLPSASGLSSSSALVIGTCLALLRANDIAWAMTQVAEEMRLAEQFVGTAGGGMDQAVISLGKPDCALLINFDPLTTFPVIVPENLKIFVINSGQKAEKSGSARFAYNRRAFECAVGVELLKSHVPQTWSASQWTSLRDVYRVCETFQTPWSELLLQAMSTDPLGIEEIYKTIGYERTAEIAKGKKLSLDEIDEWLPGGFLQVYPRVAHVLGETDRVYRFAEAMKSGNLETVFHLAQASHDSCRDLYHISTPRIENLVARALLAGAGAARITGAGFGGCVVAFLPAEKSADFLLQMQPESRDHSPPIEAISRGSAQLQIL